MAVLTRLGSNYRRRTKWRMHQICWDSRSALIDVLLQNVICSQADMYINF